MEEKSVKIKFMKVFPNPEHILTKESAEEKIGKSFGPCARISEKGTKVIKELEFKTDSYPDIKIDRMELCDDNEELVDFVMTLNLEMTKNKLFELMSALKPCDAIFHEESFPVTIKMTADTTKFEKFYWRDVKEVDEDD